MENHIACAHCGDHCKDESIQLNDKLFCCEGCKTVYQILSDNDMCAYYDMDDLPGISPKGHYSGKFAVLNNPEVEEKFLDFKDGGTAVVTFLVPNIHCSSCIWLLENLDRLNPGILSGRVNFPQRKTTITYNYEKVSLQEVAELMAMIGYAPDINMGSVDERKKSSDKSLIIKLGVAGFAFGNIMLFALPEYFHLDAIHIDQFRPFFRYISMILALPVVFYSATDYFKSSWGSLRKGYLNIDVPISIGIVVLFLWSSYEVISGIGSGYFDSLAGLLFFLLLGKLFQRKTYDHLSFERDFKSYFPISVTRLSNTGGEEQVAVTELAIGDRIRVRNEELIPCDVVLETGTAYIDNSFVTGESEPLTKHRGDKIFAGGRQKGAAITAVVSKEVSQSYLTDLWNNEVFKKDKENDFQGITDRISRRFTIAILSIALISGIVWAFIDPSRVAVIVTAILIVACPCALALSAPFALGNALRIFGKYGFYLKNASVVERLSEISHVVFDKTGTLTYGDKGHIQFEGTPLSADEEQMIAAALKQSNHPLSRRISEHLDILAKVEVSAFSETPGKGTYAVISGRDIKIGSAEFVGAKKESTRTETRVYIAIDNINRGYFAIRSRYRSGMSELLRKLRVQFKTSLISGDNNSEEVYLREKLGWKGEMYFEQKPIDKLHHIEALKARNEHVLMVGDGLNDAGALQSADVGVSLSENINNFSPACDGILTDQYFASLDDFIRLARSVKNIIYQSFAISFAYNLVGLTIAVTGHLSPVIAAILMPVSSVSVVLFVTLSTNIAARRKLSTINHNSRGKYIAE